MSNPFAESNPFGEANPFSSGGTSSGGGASSSGGYGAASGSYAPPAVSSSSGGGGGFDITGGGTSSEDLVSRKAHTSVTVEPEAPAPAPAPASALAPAPAPSAFNDPPPIASSAAAFVDPADAATMAREAELRKREAALEKSTATAVKNWPICYPVAKHYPAVDIPKGQKWMVRQAYWTYLLATITLFWNWLVVTVNWGSGHMSATGFIISLLYFLFGAVCGWWWYKSLYNACRDDKTRKFICFFVEFGIHFLFFVLGFVGLPVIYMSGIVFTINAAAKNNGTGMVIIDLIAALLWGFTVLLTLWVMRKVHNFYRLRGMEGYYAQVHGDVGKAAASAAADAAWNQARNA